MNPPRKATWMPVLRLVLVVVGSLVIGSAVEGKAQSAITVAQLAGPWQIALVGNSSLCGETSMLFTGTLNNSGTAIGTATSSGGCGTSNSSQTFSITSLNAHGTGTASLTCSAPCEFGPIFNMQVDANKRMFELDAQDGNGTYLLAGTGVKHVGAITIDQLAGPWQISLAGNTGCGRSSMEFTGILDTSGTATGTLTGSSIGCPSGSSAQTFTITSLDAEGSGTANLSCGSGCGWDFYIQVDTDRQRFNLVDVLNGGANVLAGTGTAVAQVPAITMNQLVGSWQIALVGNTGCGASSMEFTGALNTSGTGTGTLTGSSTGCPSGSSTQTFTINSLNTDGTGTASLSCGAGCGWNFNIQVSPNKHFFSLVDLGSGDPNFNELAGTAIAQGFTIVPDVAGLQWTTATKQEILAAGLHTKTFGSGGFVLETNPTGGTLVPVGSTVTVFLTAQQN